MAAPWGCGAHPAPADESGFAQRQAGRARTHTQGLCGYGMSENPTASSGASQEAQPHQPVPQRKSNQTKTTCNTGHKCISRAIFLCRAQLPQAAEARMLLILLTHKKFQQCQALDGAGTTSAIKTLLPGLPVLPKTPWPRLIVPAAHPHPLPPSSGKG